MKVKGHFGEAAWLAGTILCALGVCLSANSGFGVSMVVAPAYVIFLKLQTVLPWFTFGMSEYLFQGLIIVFVSLALRRFKRKYPLSFVTVIIYGAMLDVWRMVLGSQVYGEMWQRCVSCASGVLITAFSIALSLRTYLPQQAYELAVKEIAEAFSYNINKVKWIYDISSLIIAIDLMIVLYRNFSFNIIGVGTIILTVINTPLIAFFGKILDKNISFLPAFDKFEKRFNTLMN